MTDEFIQYTRQGIHASTEGNMLRMWGEFGEYGDDVVFPLALSYHWPDFWDNLTPGEDERPRSTLLESLATLANEAGIPLLWFGESSINWRDGMGEVEIGEILYNGDGTFNVNLELVSISELESSIQDLLGTQYSKKGASKPKNKSLNSFQEYTREYLPTALVIQDIDIITDRGPGEPTALVEIKRTNASPKSWTPYSNDWPNYYLQIALAKAGGIEPLLINHQKSIVAGDKVGFYY